MCQYQKFESFYDDPQKHVGMIQRTNDKRYTIITGYKKDGITFNLKTKERMNRDVQNYLTKKDNQKKKIVLDGDNKKSSNKKDMSLGYGAQEGEEFEAQTTKKKYPKTMNAIVSQEELGTSQLPKVNRKGAGIIMKKADGGLERKTSLEKKMDGGGKGEDSRFLDMKKKMMSMSNLK